MFALLIFTLYIVALIVTNKLDFDFGSSIQNSWGKSMEDYVTSKNPQSIADVEHSIYEYLRKGSRSLV
jgi:hypothetical protein